MRPARKVAGDAGSDCNELLSSNRLAVRPTVRALPVLEPISDVISQRANDANCKPGSKDAEQQHRIRAFYKFLVDQMGHSCPSSSRPPFLAWIVTLDLPVRLSPQPHTRVATRAWLSLSFIRHLRQRSSRSPLSRTAAARSPDA